MTGPLESDKMPERFADANGIRLCYDSFGAAADAPLLLVMGLGSQMIAWDDGFCAQLAARGFRVIRFDNRDIGRSTRFDAAGVPNIGAALMALMQGRPIAAPYLLRDMAEDARGDARPPRHHTRPRGRRVDGRRHRPVARDRASAARAQPHADHGDQRRPRPAATQTHGDGGADPTDAARSRGLYGELSADLAGAAGGPLRARRGVRRRTRGPVAILASGSRKAALAGVTVPTLVIHGDVDPLVPVECGIDVARSVPGAKLVIVEGMGHALPISMWPQIIDAITAHADASAP